MSNVLKRQLVKAILLVVLTIGYTYIRVTSDTYFAFDYFIDYLAYAFGVLMAIWIIRGVYISYEKRRWKYSIAILAIIPFSVLLTIAIKKYAAHRLDKYETENVRLSANWVEDWNGLSILLKNDDEYRIHNFSILGGEYIYGKYRIENDTIYLSTNKPLGEDSSLESDRMVIEGDSIYFIRNDEKYMGFIFRIIQRK